MAQCTVSLCGGTVERLERWRSGKFCEISAAECTKCTGAYWLIKRGTNISVKVRSPMDFDQRSKDRDRNRRDRDKDPLHQVSPTEVSSSS